MQTRRLLKTAAPARSSPLPSDFIQMVNGVLNSHFEESLKALGRLKADCHFECTGQIYPDEIVLAASLLQKGQMAATTVYASTDFDPKASSPTAQDLLGACVDAVGTLFDQLLSPQDKAQLERVLDPSLSALEKIPFDWTAVEVDRFKIYLKIDKANPTLDQMADDWLAQNDPEHEARLKREQEETEKLFIKGPSKAALGESDEGSGGGTIH